MQGDGKAEIEIGGRTIKVWFNKMAIGEAKSRFGITDDNDWINSPIQIMQFLFCAALMGGTKISYDEWAGYFEDENITGEQLELLLSTFRESAMVSNFIAEQQKVLAQLEQEEKNLKKKKERDILKKGKEPSTTD